MVGFCLLQGNPQRMRLRIRLYGNYTVSLYSWFFAEFFCHIINKPLEDYIEGRTLNNLEIVIFLDFRVFYSVLFFVSNPVYLSSNSIPYLLSDCSRGLHNKIHRSLRSDKQIAHTVVVRRVHYELNRFHSTLLRFLKFIVI